MARIVLKVDVDTWRGTREGVPALARMLERFDAPATFLFSLGPDHTGRALRRVFRRGFFAKVRRTSVLEHYGLRTLLYGTFLPGPDIGRREQATLRSIAAAGFETGIHTWDHVRWQDSAAAASAAWTRTQLRFAVERYGEVFGTRPVVHGAAGWQMNDAAFRLEAEFGIQVASDTRGTCPFLPVDESGHPIGPIQIPTTLPTLDELIGRDGWDAGNVDRALLDRTQGDGLLHVYTLHAELEGQRLLGTFERLLAGWRAQGHRFASIGHVLSTLDRLHLPGCRAVAGEIDGRSGALSLQGPAILLGALASTTG